MLLNWYHAGGASPYAAESQTYFAAMTVQPDGTRKGLIDACISGLKADGVWSKFDLFCLLAAHDQQAGLLNAAAPSGSVTMPGSSFVIDRGVKGSGVGNGYILTVGGNTINALGKYVLNSAHAGVWVNLQTASAGNTPHLSSTVGNDKTSIFARNDAGNETFRLNDSTDDILQANTGSRLGHRTVSRTASNVKRGFFNGVRTANLATASVGISAAGASWNRDGGNIYDDRYAAIYYGSGLSDAEVASVHSRLSTFLTAIGAN